MLIALSCLSVTTPPQAQNLAGSLITIPPTMHNSSLNAASVHLPSCEYLGKSNIDIQCEGVRPQCVTFHLSV